MVALVKWVASGVLMYALFLQLSTAASIPIGESVSITSPSANLTSSVLSKLIKLMSSRPDVPSEHDVEKRNAWRDPSKQWPNAEVPYELDSDFNETQQQSIRTAMEHFHNQTCIRFIERDNQVDYLNITPGDENWSQVGRQGGEQLMTLIRGTLEPNRVVLHELMHTLGFLHEHNRPDRIHHVSIKWKNIKKGQKGEFKKSNESLVELFNTTYDYSSVMHYGHLAFSKNTKRTIVPHVSFLNLGRLNKLSVKDILRLRVYYNCECIDRHDRCVYWSSDNQCANREDYMRIHCPKSCNSCLDPLGTNVAIIR